MSREFHEMQGRVLACEMMQARILNLLATAYEPDNAISMLDLFERQTMSGLQHIEIDISPESDVVWEAAGDSLRARFAIAREILASSSSLGHPQQDPAGPALRAEDGDVILTEDSLPLSGER